MFNYKKIVKSGFGDCFFENETVNFQADNDYAEAFWTVDITFDEWENDCYIFSPACAYNGNRFKKVERQYPPLYYASEMGNNEEPLIRAGIPSLNKDGSGKIEVTSGDMATPCIGIFFKRARKAFFLFTRQEVKGENLGFCIENNRIQVQYPSKREHLYGRHTSEDKGFAVKKGEKISSELLIRFFACKDIPEFFDLYFQNRKILLRSERPENGYTEDLWRVMEKHFNTNNWSGKFYGTWNFSLWQCGWMGPGMSSYALYKLGGEITKRRAIQTVDWLTSYIAPTGFFYGMVYDGVIKDDTQFHLFLKSKIEPNEKYAAMKDAHFVRKSGDALLFLYKHFEVMPVKDKWIQAAKGCADAFVRLFAKYGTFGQFVNVETGEMQITLSCAGASAVGALVKSWEYFKNSVYLETAKKAGDFYYENFVSKGITCGGPMEILTAPDSESAYAFVESYVLLYEATKEEKWLKYAKDSAHLFSSWVMTYAYKFPKGCEFDILKVNTVGSVFANVQNKHSAPGICTFSGDTLYRLYLHTGNEEYLELIKDIAYFIPQCVSLPNRPIYDWDHEHGDEKGRLPDGYICERVNTSDWETKACIGGVFNVSCWPETSLILTFAELNELLKS